MITWKYHIRVSTNCYVMTFQVTWDWQVWPYSPYSGILTTDIPRLNDGSGQARTGRGLLGTSTTVSLGQSLLILRLHWSSGVIGHYGIVTMHHSVFLTLFSPLCTTVLF